MARGPFLARGSLLARGPFLARGPLQASSFLPSIIMWPMAGGGGSHYIQLYSDAIQRAVPCILQLCCPALYCPLLNCPVLYCLYCTALQSWVERIIRVLAVWAVSSRREATALHQTPGTGGSQVSRPWVLGLVRSADPGYWGQSGQQTLGAGGIQVFRILKRYSL